MIAKPFLLELFCIVALQWTMKKQLLIGLTGKARSGKDTVGKYLVDVYGYRTYAFAEPLKQACAFMFGVDIDYFYNPLLKEKVIPEWGYSPRQMAQKLGTEGGRELFRQDIWIVRAQVELNKYLTNQRPRAVVVTDVRFDDEAAWIRKNGGQVWQIDRKGIQKVSEHKSEAGIILQEEDIVINNNGTLEELYAIIDESITGEH